MSDSDSKWKLLSPSAKTALGILSVDNLKVSEFGMDLLVQISQGRITHRQAREMLREHATELAQKNKASPGDE